VIFLQALVESSIQHKVKQLTIGLVSHQLIPVADGALEPLHLQWIPAHLKEHQLVACVAGHLAVLAYTQLLVRSIDTW
jgi:hypothetical protein